jgi:hypothetical protein
VIRPRGADDDPKYTRAHAIEDALSEPRAVPGVLRLGRWHEMPALQIAQHAMLAIFGLAYWFDKRDRLY